MSRSVPPPGYIAPPVKPPNYLLRGALATAGLIAVVLVFVLATRPGPGCVVNGYGNKLCGNDAVSYCEVLARQGALGPFGTNESAEACARVGWDGRGL